MTDCRRLARFFVGLAAFVSSARAAEASPWTLPRGNLVLAAGYNFQTASQEFFESGSARNYPLRGRYTGSTYVLGVRAGLAENLEFEAQLPVRLVAYDSDPVIVLARPMGDTSAPNDFSYYRNNIINLARSASGISDLVFATRYRLAVRSAPSAAFAFELRIKVPTGYQGPSGTFGDRPTSAADFLANATRYVTPQNVRDDVTLGDGQVDIAPSFLFGYAWRSRTFMRLDLGYNLRLGGAGHQVTGALRAGQALGDRLLVYGGIQCAFTVTQGRLLGISVAAVNPDVAAADYTVENLLIRELRFERDSIDVGAGLIVRLNPQAELNVGYQRTLWGRNTALVDAFNLAVAMRTSLLTGR